MLRVAICDDRTEQLEIIKTALLCYADCHSEQEIVLQQYSNPLLFLESLSQNGGVDVLLLDICMPGILGTEVAQEIRKRHDKTEIIFLTTSDEFAVDAFALRAVHYIVKPFTQAQFNEAMDRAVANFAAGQMKKITLKLEGGGVMLLDIQEIDYLESFGHAQLLHPKNGDRVEIRQSMAQLLEQLEEAAPGQFISPYKGYIVNQLRIRTIGSGGIVLQGGQVLPIVKRGLRKLREQYFTFVFGKAEQE